MPDARRLTPEEVDALWRSGQIRRWEDGRDLPAPRAERSEMRLRDDRVPVSGPRWRNIGKMRTRNDPLRVEIEP